MMEDYSSLRHKPLIPDEIRALRVLLSSSIV